MAKDNKTKKMLDDVFNASDEQKDSMMMLYVGEDNKPATYFVGDSEKLAAMVASVIHEGLQPNAGKGVESLAIAIIEGVKKVLSFPNYDGIILGFTLLSAIKEARVKANRGIVDIADFAKLFAKENDGKENDDEEEDCEHCPLNKDCPLPAAKEFRKENAHK